jgi:glucokinase
MILAGDVGGTSTRLALFARDGSGRLGLLAERIYPSRAHDSLDAILTLFLKEEAARPDGPAGPIEAASFGAAGPVRRGRCETTNLPWVIEADRLAAIVGLPAAGLINDLEANAWGLEELGPSDVLVLSPGAPGAGGNSAIIAAGTGLGEAGLFWDGRRHLPFATEGGHADFSPRNETEDDLLRYLRARFGRVSWERVVSGPGLASVYGFLRDTGRGEEPSWMAEEVGRGDPAAAITAAAREGRCPLASLAVDLFVSLYGAEAGNLALKTLATGGLYVGGGIAPRISDRLQHGGFMEAFTAKGRMRTLLESIPVRVVLNPSTALLGAARHASGALDGA